MILRYGIESKHAPTFTASVKVENKEQAEKKVAKFKHRNKIIGYMKYFSATLYSDDNVEVCKFPF